LRYWDWKKKEPQTSEIKEKGIVGKDWKHMGSIEKDGGQHPLPDAWWRTPWC
jgi:hypothetical protein